MDQAPTSMTVTPGRGLTVTRMFNAPRALVFAAWSDPKLLAQWWGPVHHPSVSVDMDLPGGKWRNGLRSVENGEILWHHGEFIERVPPERLVFTFAWEEEGERGEETVVTITFEDFGHQTRMTLHQTPFLSVGERDGHSEGWSSSFDRLEALLAQEQA